MMFKKRLSLLMVVIFTISIMSFAVGCGQQEAAEPTPVQVQEPTPSQEVNEEEILTQAAIDYFTYLQGNNMIDAATVNEQINNVYVLDIRKSEDFAKGHIPGAHNTVMEKIGEIIPELPTNQSIVVACYSGQTASQATGVLRMAGFDALAMKGGFPSWEKAGFEIEQ